MPLSLVAPLFDAKPASGEASWAEIEAAETHHRVANSLTLVAGLLRMQASALAKGGPKLSSNACAEILLEAAARIETVGRLHGGLAHTGGLRLAAVVRDAAEATVASLARPGQMRLRLKIDEDCAAPSQLTLPIVLAVGELVTNSIKYAHPAGVEGDIEVRCGRDAAGALEIAVSDDGVGLPEGFDPMVSSGLGLRLVRVLAQQMGAGLTFTNTELGLTVRLRLPRREEAAETIP